jgi:signal transduction histidine kinase
MNRQLHLLLVEDNTDDAALLLRQLRGGNWDLVHERVDSAAGMAAALDAREWDLVVADYSLPGFSGLDALAMVKQRGLDAPFILVSGAIGEDTAVAAMKSGAQDFILKGQPARLLPAVERELQEAEVRKARRRGEEQLEAHRATIERANRELERNNHRLADLYSTAQRFVDNVSHEFRTPLTVIKGYSQAMAEGMAGPVSEQQAEFLGFIVDRTRELAQMVEDLLDSSKLRAGTLRVDRRQACVHDIVAKVRPMLQRMATARNVRISERLDDGLPEVFADAEKAGRVIINLVVNAIKFSPENSEVTLWGRPASDGGVQVGVSDQGPGIAPENLAVIFQRFKRVGNAPKSSTDGIGLGLNIAEELVALNLGVIDVASEPGKGSTFSFTLPPNDPAEVMRRHLDYLSITASLTSLAAIRVSCGLEGGIDGELRGFIASAINPLDLILDTLDHNSLLIVGASADPERFSERLRAAMESVCGRFGGPGPTEALQVEHVGTWHYPAEEDKAVERILQELSQEAVHV